MELCIQSNLPVDRLVNKEVVGDVFFEQAAHSPSESPTGSDYYGQVEYQRNYDYQPYPEIVRGFNTHFI